MVDFSYTELEGWKGGRVLCSILPEPVFSVSGFWMVFQRLEVKWQKRLEPAKVKAQSFRLARWSDFPDANVAASRTAW